MSIKKKRLISKEDLLDPTPLLDQAIQSGLDTGYSSVNDRDIKKAKNAVEWTIGAEFLNVVPYPKQLQDIIFFFSSVCFFCSDTAWLVNTPRNASLGEILERCQLMINGRCPRCKRNVVEMRYEWCLDPSRCFDGYIKPDVPNELCAVKGQRSGKSIEAAIMSTYVLHRYLKLPNPSRWFGLLKKQVLHMTFCAVTAKQAWENMWQPFSDLVDDSPWFQEYHKFLDDEAQRLGAEFWSKKDTYLWYGHKRLSASFAPSDVRSLRGRTRYLTVIDEMGWYGSSNGVMADGDGTHRSLDRSLATLRNAARFIRKKKPNTPDAYMLTISSPSSVIDPIMRRYNNSAKSPRVYAIKLATWQCHPTMTEEDLRSQEGLVGELQFQSDYGANPPYSDDPWWESRAHLEGLCRKETEVTSRAFSYHLESQPDMSGKWNWIWADLTPLGMDKFSPRILTLDVGEKACSFSWALSHYNRQEDMCIVDEVGEVAPGENERIHLSNMWLHTILPLVRAFRFIHIVWDRWESSNYVSELRTTHKIRAEQYSVKSTDCKMLRSDMLNSKISFPTPETTIEQLPIGNNRALANFPRTHLLLQILTIRGASSVPIKPQGGNDDTFRCVLLANAFLRQHTDEYKFGAAYSKSRCVALGRGGRGVGGGGNSITSIMGANGTATALGGRVDVRILVDVLQGFFDLLLHRIEDHEIVDGAFRRDKFLH